MGGFATEIHLCRRPVQPLSILLPAGRRIEVPGPTRVSGKNRHKESYARDL
jgi:hypothetical protein